MSQMALIYGKIAIICTLGMADEYSNPQAYMHGIERKQYTFEHLPCNKMNED